MDDERHEACTDTPASATSHVLVRMVVPTMRSRHVRGLSYWQRQAGTMRVHDDHARMRKEGEAYGTFQQGHLAGQSDARSCAALYTEWDPDGVLQSRRPYATDGAA